LWRISTAGWSLRTRGVAAETDKAIGLIDRFAACSGDYRSTLFTVHPLEALIAQRVFGLALGYEGLNNHDDLAALARLQGEGADWRRPLRLATDSGKC
jgi:hypothetical protein